MVRFLVVLSGIVALVFGQDDCSNPPKNIITMGCCEPPKWDETGTIKACNKSANTLCYAECILKETNVVKNGELQPANVKAFIETELKQDADYIPIAIKAFEKCFPMVKQRMIGKKSQVDGCDTMAAAVLECAEIQIFINCPAKKWKAGSDCETLKNFLVKCPLPSFDDDWLAGRS